MITFLPAQVMALPAANLSHRDRRWVLEQVVEKILARLDAWDGDADLEPELPEIGVD